MFFRRQQSPHALRAKRLACEALELRSLMAGEVAPMLPLAVSDYLSAREDATLVGEIAGLLANDQSSVPLRAVVATQPSFGSITFDDQGNYSYVPTANFWGTDSFRYNAIDSAGRLSTATVFVAVAPVNDAPIARSDWYTLVQSGSLTLAPYKLKANSFDTECQALSVRILDGPQNGSFDVSAAGEISYTPRNGFAGQDQITYCLNDGSLSSEPVTITLDVTPPVETKTYQLTIGAITTGSEADGELHTRIIITPTPPPGETVMVRVTPQVTGSGNGYASTDDFSPLPIDLVFDQFATNLDAPIAIFNDNLWEGPESFLIEAKVVSNGASGSAATKSLTIADNEVAPADPVPDLDLDRDGIPTAVDDYDQPTGMIDPKAMLQQLKQAIASNATSYTIAPGIYDFTGSTFQFRLSGVKDFDVHAEGVTFVFAPRVAPIAVFLHQCENVSLTGLTIDYSPLPFTQGTIEKINADGSFEVLLDEGYSLLDDSWTKAGGGNTKTIVFGPDGSMRPQVMDWLASASSLGGRRFLCTTQQKWLFKEPGTQIQIGDSIVFPDRQYRQTIQLTSCIDCTLEDVTLWSAPQMGFIEVDSQGTSFIDCDIIRKPNSNRLLSSNADGIFSKNSQATQVIGSHLEYTGDDMLNIHASLQYVLPGGLGLVWTLDDLQVGQQIDLFDQAGKSQGKATIQNIVEETNSRLISQARAEAKSFGILPATAAKLKVVRIALDRTVSEPMIVSSDALLPKNLLVANSTFTGGYGRGVIISGSGQISDNTFTDLASASIWVGADAEWAIGPVPHDVLIQNNVIVGSNRLLHRLPQTGAITIGNSFDDYLFGVLSNIELVGNTITGSKRGNIVFAPRGN